jgi:hypothetical protein
VAAVLAAFQADLSELERPEGEAEVDLLRICE